MRIERTTNLGVWDDADKTIPLCGPDKDSAATEVMDGVFKRVFTGKFEVAADSNENLSFGDITDVRGLRIVADGDFNAKFNGSSDVVPFKKADATTGRKVHCVMDADLTGVNIVNPSLTAVLTGRYTVYGDLEA